MVLLHAAALESAVAELTQDLTQALNTAQGPSGTYT